MFDLSTEESFITRSEFSLSASDIIITPSVPMLLSTSSENEIK
jgi:hypothetical protein